jgi:hypothetical protein
LKSRLRFPLYRISLESRKNEMAFETGTVTSRTPRGGNFEAGTESGRVLLVLPALLIFVTPCTKYFWEFDKFLRSGQDFEPGPLSLAALLWLVVVLLQHGRQSVAFLLAIRRRLSFVSRD